MEWQYGIHEGSNILQLRKFRIQFFNDEFKAFLKFKNIRYVNRSDEIV